MCIIHHHGSDNEFIHRLIQKKYILSGALQQLGEECYNETITDEIIDIQMYQSIKLNTTIKIVNMIKF